MKRSFTLVEILIVVAILGILAALALPQFQSHAQEARESAAKDNLRILRNAIEIYAAQNDGIPPGYPNNDASLSPSNHAFQTQMIGNNKYLPDIPSNPFNEKKTIALLDNDEVFPAEPLETNLYGWVYQPVTKTIKLNWTNTDSEGVAYFDY